MFQVCIIIDCDFMIVDVFCRFFGLFVEYMGCCVYIGIYEFGYLQVDECGFWQDVLVLVKEMGLIVVCYFGGNFVFGYCWEDGVGFVEDCLVCIDGVWYMIEMNVFGLYEFMVWVKEVDVEVMEVVNFGICGVEEVCVFVEYVNYFGGIYWFDL